MGHHAPITFALNREGEIWFEVAGEAQMHSRPQPEYSAEKLMRLANGIAAQSAQHVSAAHPLLSARIDGVGRVQLALPPVSGEGAAFAIRRAVTKRRSTCCASSGARYPWLSQRGHYREEKHHCVRRHE